MSHFHTMPALKDWRKLAFLAACVLPFLGFWATGLTDLDEGYYGAVVANMLRTGDWITPHFNGSPWFEKPVLLYWLAAPSVAAFGEALGPRLPSVLSTLLTALVLFKFLKRHLDERTARIATAAYCGSLLVVGVGRMLLTDAPFVLALTVALTTFYDSITGTPRMRLWTAVALGAAVLAKGPVAGVLFLLVAGFTYWRMADLRKGFKGYWLTGFALFSVVVAAWYVPAYLANKDLFVQKFLIEQNLGRFSGGDLAHKTPLWAVPFYFPAVLFLALMPWSCWALRAKWFQWPQDALARYLWIWGLVVLGFFSASLTKLPHYVLPAIAPLTVVTVTAVLKRRADEASADFWLKCALAWSLVLFSFVTVAFTLDYQDRFAEVHQVATYLRDKPGAVVMFDVGRHESDVAPAVTINDSSKPSFFFYLRREGKMTRDVTAVAKMTGPVWLVVQKGRVEPELMMDLRLGGFAPARVELPFETKKYELWRLDPLAPPGGP